MIRHSDYRHLDLQTTQANKSHLLYHGYLQINSHNFSVFELGTICHPTLLYAKFKNVFSAVSRFTKSSC